jgi:hypothetical protein
VREELQERLAKASKMLAFTDNASLHQLAQVFASEEGRAMLSNLFATMVDVTSKRLEALDEAEGKRSDRNS